MVGFLTVIAGVGLVLATCPDTVNTHYSSGYYCSGTNSCSYKYDSDLVYCHHVPGSGTDCDLGLTSALWDMRTLYTNGVCLNGICTNATQDGDSFRVSGLTIMENYDCKP